MEEKDKGILKSLLKKNTTFCFVLGYSLLTSNAVIISREQQRDSSIHVHVPILPQTLPIQATT